MKRVLYTILISGICLFSCAQHFDYVAMVASHITFDDQRLSDVKSKAGSISLSKTLNDLKPDENEWKSLSPHDKKSICQFKSVLYINAGMYRDALREIILSAKKKANGQQESNIDKAIKGIIYESMDYTNGAFKIFNEISWKDTVSDFQQKFKLAVSSEKENIRLAKKVLMQSYSLSEAVSEYDRILCLFKMAEISRHQKEWNDAISSYESVYQNIKGKKNLNTNEKIRYTIQSNTALLDSLRLYSCLALAEVFKTKGENSKAVNWAEVVISDVNADLNLKTRALMLRAVIATLASDYDLADAYFSRALSSAKKGNTGTAEILNLRAKNFYLWQHFGASVQDCENAINVSDAKVDFDNLMVANHLLYQNYLMTGDYAEAQNHYQSYIVYRHLVENERRKFNGEHKKHEIEMQIMEKEVEAAIAQELELEHEAEKALLLAEQRSKELQLLKKENELKERDFLFQKLEKEKIEKDIVLLSQKLEIEKTNFQKQQLEKEALLHSLAINRERSEVAELKAAEVVEKQTRKVKESELKSEIRVKWILFGGLIVAGLLVVLTLYLLYRNSQQKKVVTLKNRIISEKVSQLEKQMLELNEKKVVIEQKNKQISESITYALSIQNALLPQPEMFGSAFSDSFIFYKPRDIVSGDCYYLRRKENKICFAMIDCSGHGVPGAFISAISIQQIDHLLSSGNYSPAALIEELHLYFINTVNAATKNSANGMDITFVEYDSSARRLVYAGAKGNFMVYNGDSLTEYKTTRMSVGQNTQLRENFCNNEISLNEGDVLYFYTDGLLDQFDSVTRKRIGTKAFTQFIGSLCTLPFKQQHNRLQQFYEERVGNNSQVDDITVIALKV